MKRLIITHLFLMTVLPMLACLGGWTYNYYLFNIYDDNDFSNRMLQVSNDNWKAYLGIGQQEWFYFDAEKVEKAAKAKNDPLMASYARQLERYLQCADEVSRESWDYPTKEQLAQRKATLASIRSYASGKLTSRLRSQHGLLLMRANMLLGRHQDNVMFWEQTASRYIESVYKDMMQNIYAGSLYKTGNVDRAGELFAQQGDYKSLMTIYYKKRSMEAIRAEYQKNANARVLPFLLQDFVNNAQEADDGTGPDDTGGKLFIRYITQNEARQMTAFCQQVVSEQKSACPAMWQTAKAWLEYMFGSKQQALTDIRQATGMEGTDAMKDCARIIRIYIESTLTEGGIRFDNWIGDELTWLYNSWRPKNQVADNNYQLSDSNERYGRAFTRIVHEVLAEKYDKLRQHQRTAALYAAGGFGEFREYMDTTTVDNVLRYKAYMKQTRPETKLDAFLQEVGSRSEETDDHFNDLVGTKHLRLCHWTEAAKWLSRVPVSYYNTRGYVRYACYRSMNIEPWIKRQWLTDDQAYGEQDPILKDNPKLQFAHKMQAMEGQLNILQGQARQQACYRLAVCYAQAHFTGDCWFLMRDGKSVSDTLRPNETDLAARCHQLLQEAAKSTDLKLKERALFALSYGELSEKRWYDTRWNSETYNYDILPQPTAAQWKAFARLADFEAGNAVGQSRYVTLCDEYVQFCKHYHH